MSDDRTTGLGLAMLMVAWEAGELSEGQMCSLLELDRVSLRRMREDTIAAGMQLADVMQKQLKTER